MSLTTAGYVARIVGLDVIKLYVYCIRSMLMYLCGCCGGSAEDAACHVEIKKCTSVDKMGPISIPYSATGSRSLSLSLSLSLRIDVFMCRQV